MNGKELLDLLVDLNMGTSETDVLHPGDIIYYLYTKLNEGNGVTIPKKLYDILGCDEIYVYLADSTDENDRDQIEIIYNPK